MTFPHKAGLLVVTIVLFGSIGYLLEHQVHASPTSLSTPSIGAGDAVLAARLGGTRASFEAMYGSPVATTEDGPRYKLAGTGFIDIQYQPSLEPSLDDRALIINLRPNRPGDKPVTTPDPADWSLSRALVLVHLFLPQDATLGSIMVIGDHDRTAACLSAALATQFPRSLDAGGCRVDLTTPTADTVSFITITLSATGVVATPIGDSLQRDARVGPRHCQAIGHGDGAPDQGEHAGHERSNGSDATAAGGPAVCHAEG